MGPLSKKKRIHGKSGYLEKAEREYRIALELNDGFQFPEVESNLLLNLGNTYMALNNFREAYRQLPTTGQSIFSRRGFLNRTVVSKKLWRSLL